MTTGAYFILFSFAALMTLIGYLDRRANRVLTIEECEEIGAVCRIAKRLAARKVDPELRKKMGIRQD